MRLGVREAAGLGTAMLVLLAGFAGAMPQTGAKKPVGKSVPALSRVEFNRDIRPILSDNCFACHGPDKNKRQAGLRLDERAAALARKAIVPGDVLASSLVRRVLLPDGDPRQMPPASIHKKLTPGQIKSLLLWIEQGAEYQAHWAYIAPKRPVLLPVKTPGWVRNPVDRFILARLEQEGVKPSPEADKRTLLRRLSLDLIGIPPTPEEVTVFLSDKSPNAYEKQVDRLLSSPHYGERMAVPWLDAVRYADTVGFHGDQNQNAWAYRDYVIDAFNRNKPFDRFTIEQIAGDLLPNPTPETLTATCVNRMNMMTREGGAQAKEYLAKYAADRVRTVSMAWMGSTFGCAECHDHKYDPISQKDFYAMAAFFADVQQWGVYADYGYTPNPDLRGYNNDYPFPPETIVESRYLKERIGKQERQIAKVVAGTATRLDRAAFDTWRKSATTFLADHPDGWETPTPTAKVVSTVPPKKDAPPPPVPTHRVESGGRLLLTDKSPASAELTFTPKTPWIASLRWDLLPSPESENRILRINGEGATLNLAASIRRADGKTERIAIRYAGANIAEPRYDNGFEILGVHRGWRVSNKRGGETHTAVYRLDKPLQFGPGDSLVVSLPNLAAGSIRLSVSPLMPQELDSATLPAILDGPNGEYTALRQYLYGTAWDAEAFAQVKSLEADIVACRNGKTPVLVTKSIPPTVTRVLPRGNWQDDSGAVVEPATPHFLTGYRSSSATERLSRLDLAKWLVSPQNPLTARVFVNRLWKQFFGNGLSGQVEDLGAQGEWPTHPELLDWLAVEFRESGWNVKKVVRQIVTSATYRQSSELRERDPNNRLLASQSPRRLEAEFIRDNALSIVGILNPDLGGPPIKPYQPDGYYASIQFPDRNYRAETDDRQWRRAVYMHWQRTFLHPMLVNFDAPSREDPLCTRTIANTPQQALTLLNDPSFVEAARIFADHLLSAKASNDAARLELAFQRALSRSAKLKERQSLLLFLGKVREEYKARPEDAAKLLKVGIAPTSTSTDPIERAAWTTVCRVILNLHETITRY